MTGRSGRASPIPSGIPIATPTAPSSRLSFMSSRRTAPSRTPTARMTPSCQARSSKRVASRLKAIRNPATTPSDPTPCRKSWRECITLWRSAFRWKGASTRSPAGSTAAIASATRATSSPRSTTTSTRLMYSGRVNAFSAAKISITTRFPPCTRPMPSGSIRPRTVNQRRPVGVSSSSLAPTSSPRGAAKLRGSRIESGWLRNTSGSSIETPPSSRTS